MVLLRFLKQFYSSNKIPPVPTQRMELLPILIPVPSPLTQYTDNYQSGSRNRSFYLMILVTLCCIFGKFNII